MRSRAAIGSLPVHPAVVANSGWLGGKMVFEMWAGVVEPGESSKERP